MIGKWISGALAVMLLCVPVSAQTLGPNYADLVEKLRPSVVVLKVKRPDEVSPLSDLFKSLPKAEDSDDDKPALREETGSGFVFDAAQGLIVTTDYLVDGASSIDVILASGAHATAKVVGFDTV